MTKLQQKPTSGNRRVKKSDTDSEINLIERFNQDNFNDLIRAGLTRREAANICKSQPRIYKGLLFNNKNPHSA